MKSEWKKWLPEIFLFLLLFIIPFEYKYDKLFRFYSLTLIPDGLILPPFFEGKIYFYPSDLLGIVLFLFSLRGEKLLGRGVIFLVIVFIAAVFSLLASPFSHYSLAYLRLWQLFTPLALFLFLANGPIDERGLMKRGSWALFGSSLMQMSIAIPQYFLQRPLGLKILSERPLEAAVTVPSGKVCFLDFARREGGDQIYRAMGTFSHPNVLAGFLAVSSLLTLYLFLAYPKKRIWLGLSYFIQLFVMSTTYSRAAIYASVLGTLFYLFWLKFRQEISIFSPTLLFIISTLFVGVLMNEQYLNRGGIVNYNTCARASDSLRLHYQRVAMRMIEDHLWLGVGYGRFSCEAAHYLDEGADPSLAKGGVHNIYMRLAAETGLISLTAFLSWCLLLLWAGWRAPPNLETGFLMATFLGLLFIGCCDQYLILFQQGKLLFFAVAGLLARHGRFERKASFQYIPI